MAWKTAARYPVAVISRVTLVLVATVLAPCWCSAEETPEQLLQAVYGAELQKVKASPETNDDRALANRLISDSKGLQQDKAMQAAMLRQAVALAVEDAECSDPAQAATESLIADLGVPAPKAWQELIDKAAGGLRKRKIGRTDAMAEPYCGWQLRLAAAAYAADDLATAERALAALVRDTQGYKFKYLADEAYQLQVRLKLEIPARQAAAAAKAGVTAADPKSNLQAVETILCHTGNWLEAEPFIVKANDPRVTQIALLRKQRAAATRPMLDELLVNFPLPAAPLSQAPPSPIPPATPATLPNSAEAAATPATLPPAESVLAAVDYLNELAAPTRKPSPQGKLFLLREAADLLAQMAQLDQAAMTTAQKLTLVTRARAARDTEAKARNEALNSFDRTGKLNWIHLQTGSLKEDWKPHTTFDLWKVLDSGEIQSTGGDWDQKLMSNKATFVDFVFEGECFREGPGAQAAFYFGDFKAPYYRLEIIDGMCGVGFQWGPGGNKDKLQSAIIPLPVREWVTVKVAVESDHQIFWINGKRVMETRYKGVLRNGTPGINAERGGARFRNLRIRELK